MCIQGPQQPTPLVTTGNGRTGYRYTKRYTSQHGTITLHELSSDCIPVILQLATRRQTETITRFFTNWDKYSEYLETTLPLFKTLPSTSALLDDAVALFESTLYMVGTTATITREVTYTTPIACLTN
ncbi:hypothetical protein Zmor_028497 [Zophobas morio]|uniref:Uncharacterized protein n=1 Tax=Zophobas morio TaxID=2755281 RepID=A0AA38LZL1_9CUCU|nr:hypothetical protein Zmor_028497 [Zophobas morio]